MAITKKFNESDYKKFEADLLTVLKKDSSHKLDFDGKLIFRSSRYDCLLAATDVFWDEKTGDIVLVGAFKSGKPVMDQSKGYSVMREHVSVPLKECFEDLKMSSGMEMRLLGKARKAVIDKYVSAKLNLYSSRSIMRDGILDLKSLGIGEFIRERASGFPVDHTHIDAVMRDSDGKVSLVCTNSLSTGFDCPLSSMPLADIQLLGAQLERVNKAFSEASDIYTSKLQSLEPRNMSYSDAEQRQHREAALMEVFNSKASLDICNAVARTFTSWNIFDRQERSLRDIKDSVKNYYSKGSLTVSAKELQQLS